MKRMPEPYLPGDDSRGNKQYRCDCGYITNNRWSYAGHISWHRRPPRERQLRSFDDWGFTEGEKETAYRILIALKEDAERRKQELEEELSILRKRVQELKSL
jgi:hypothetical protein